MKMKRGITTLLSVAVLSTSLVACSGTQEKTVAKEEKVKLTDQQLMADLWYQTAGETKALYYQGYNIGQLKLDAALAKGTEKKPAIVLDLDETVLDNSPHQAMSVKQEKAIRINGMIGLIRLKLRPFQVQLISYNIQSLKV